MSDALSLEPRRGRMALAVALVAGLTLLCCGGGGMVALLGGLFDKESPNVSSFGCGSTTLIDPNQSLPRAAQLGDAQMHNAAIIIKVGQQMKVPPRGWVIAIATSLQESRLINVGNLGSRNDHDSLGLFQQRPSQGWGTPAQIMDPQYSSQKFYEKLLKVPNWERLALTDAAQRVQISAFPDAYAKHEPLATLAVNILTDGAAQAAVGITDLRCVLTGELSAAGWTVPLKGKIVSGFRTPSRPTHYGDDLAASRGTVVHAASSGTVVRVRCDAHTAAGVEWGCDRDGSPSIRGCGWYVDILHAGAIMTRYCHMVRRPDVTLGQSVTAGQQIGLSGTSGNSSGPHLHFEVHLNGDHSNAGAVDPERFMRDVGAPLGDGAP
jgi:murein DD-endopeptidase MepM/ murein hydrolase activator NlpD